LTVPTTRRRHFVTETDAVAAALDDAAVRWPEDRDNRAKLLLRLVEAGHRSVLDAHDEELAARRAGIESAIGALSGMYEPGYLEELRKDWPE
jgi:hypothetical protein